jgi:hypothetical protein
MINCLHDYVLRGFGSVRDCAAKKFLLDSSLHSFSRICCGGSRTCSGALGNCRDFNDQKVSLFGNDFTTVRGLRGTSHNRDF